MNTAASAITVACPNAMIRAGMVLPTMIIPGVSGETRSWSSVPCSRSRATESAVTIRLPSVVMIATSTGSMNQRYSRLGLYLWRTITALGSENPAATARSAPYPSITVCA